MKLKIIVAGDGGCGKSTLIRRLVIGEFTDKYIPTFYGQNSFTIPFLTNYGLIEILFFESSGSEKWGPLRDYQV